jgi:hypothetical protein
VAVVRPPPGLDRKRARWFGVLYLMTFVTSIPALLLNASIRSGAAAAPAGSPA